MDRDSKEFSQLVEAAQTDPQAAEVLHDYFEEQGSTSGWRKHAKLLRGEMSPRFAERVEHVKSRRKQLEKSEPRRKLIPLFDHLIGLALNSYKHGHAQTAGQYLSKAHRIAMYGPKALRPRRRFRSRRSW